jgi:predicted dinucleotide-binding enzyme
MTTANIGLGRIGSPLAHELFLGGEPVVLANRDQSKAMTLATRLIGGAGMACVPIIQTRIMGLSCALKISVRTRYNRNAAAANGNPGDTFGTDHEAT